MASVLKHLPRPIARAEPDWRSLQRDRRARLTSITIALAKAVGIATSLATIPLTMRYLGNERFGLWMTINSLTALLAFADFGLGNGLLNAIADANGRDDRVTIRRLIASALAVLLGLGLCVGLILTPLIFVSDLSSTFGLKESAAIADLRPALLAFVACFVLNLLAGVFQRALSALQEGFLNGALTIIASVLSLLLLLAMIHFEAGLHWLVFALLGVPAVISNIGGWLLLNRRHRDLVPLRSDVDLSLAVILARTGGLFFVLQLASSLAYSSDNLIGSALIGATEVGEFAVTAKLFSVATIVTAILVSPLWPAYGEALSRGDWAWVQHTLKHSLLKVIAISVATAVLLCLGFPAITNLWLSEPLSASPTLLVGFGMWVVLSGAGAAIAMFLNGAHVVRPQVVIAIIFAGSCVAFKLLFAQKFGLSIFPWINSILYFAIVLVPYALIVPKLLGRSKSGAPLVS